MWGVRWKKGGRMWKIQDVLAWFDTHIHLFSINLVLSLSVLLSSEGVGNNWLLFEWQQFSSITFHLCAVVGTPGHDFLRLKLWDIIEVDIYSLSSVTAYQLDQQKKNDPRWKIICLSLVFNLACFCSFSFSSLIWCMLHVIQRDYGCWWPCEWVTS